MEGEIREIKLEITTRNTTKYGNKCKNVCVWGKDLKGRISRDGLFFGMIGKLRSSLKWTHRERPENMN